MSSCDLHPSEWIELASVADYGCNGVEFSGYTAAAAELIFDPRYHRKDQLLRLLHARKLRLRRVRIRQINREPLQKRGEFWHHDRLHFLRAGCNRFIQGGLLCFPNLAFCPKFVLREA